MIYQEDEKDCGVACLSMIIQHYQGKVPYEELKERLAPVRNGITAHQLIEVAKSLGFEVKGLEGDFSSFSNASIMLPCIAHVLIEKTYYHYIVLFEINFKKKYFIIGDPSKGIYKMSFSEFESIWTHVVITFYPKTPIPYIESNHILKNDLLQKLANEKKTIFTMILLSIVVTIVSILHTTILNHFVSMLETHDEFLYLILSVFLYLSFILLKNQGNYLRNKLFFHVYQRIDFEFMKLIFYQILHLPYRYYKNRTTGDMMARIQDIGVIRTFMAKITLSSFMDFPLLLVSGIFLFFIETKLFFIALITLILYFLFFLFYQNLLSRKVEKMEEENAKVMSYLVESLNGYDSICGSHFRESVETKFSKKYITYLNTVKELENTQNQKQTINQVLFEGSTLAILALGIWLVAKGQATISSLLLFHSLFFYFIEPVKNFLELSEEWKKVKISWRRLSHLFHEQKEIGIYEKSVIGTIEFRNATFAYGCECPVLKHASFKIQAGSKILLTGVSGSGKSTILKLLMKYYEIEPGMIYLDGIDIRDYKMGAIEQNILYISMREQLFTGPLCENINLKGQYDEDYQKVLKVTEVDEMIRKNKQGHYLLLEENGANLSGGERQRIILARTLLLPYQILLLDEATSQIDVNMERRILKNIWKEFPNKTVLVVSHRVDNADLFDQWIEMDHGMIKKDVAKYGTV